MQRIVLGLAAALALVVTALAPVSAQYVPSGSYQQSCAYARVRGDQLIARCRVPNGDTVRTSISISSCNGGDIANSNGQLTCNTNRYDRRNGNGNGNGNGYGYGRGNGYAPGGSYQQSCTGVQMRGSMLTGTCTAPNGNLITSTIDTSRCRGLDILNDNGRLQCR